MKSGRSGPRPGALISGAAFGSIAGHALVYLLLIPNVISREAFLRQTGHGAWPGVAAAGLVLGAYAAIATGLHSFREGRSSVARVPRVFRWARVLPAVCLLQVFVFFTREVFEHLDAGAPLSSLGGPRFLLVAVVVQAVVGVVVTAALYLLARTAAVIGAAFRLPSRSRCATTFPIPGSARRPVSYVVDGTLIRGPPVTVGS
jgi:hypothetical protein